MTITTPLHGDHQLDQLAAQFAHWRQTRTHPYERIPHELWEHAVTLAATLPPSRVAKQLRVRLMDLKKRMATRCEGTPPGSPLSLGFVEVPSAPSGPQPAVVTQIELSRADGTRLCIHTPMSPLALEALVRAFVEGRSCCSSPPQSRIFVATEPVDFRKGIDGLAAVCRQVLGDNPLIGAVYVFRNRAGTALKLWLYDGQGYWLSRTVHNASIDDWDGRDARTVLFANCFVVPIGRTFLKSSA